LGTVPITRQPPVARVAGEQLVTSVAIQDDGYIAPCELRNDKRRYRGGIAERTIVVEEKLVRDLAPQLSEAGARAIIETPLNKIIE